MPTIDPQPCSTGRPIHFHPVAANVRRALIVLILQCFLSVDVLPAQGPGLPETTWAEGTYLGFMPLGGRVSTFHRGYLYLGAQSTTSLWDISDPTAPLELQHFDVGVNGHTWLKIGDLFWRQYWIPEHGNSQAPQFQDLSDMLNRTPWVTQDQSFNVMTNQWSFLQTFPLLLGANGITDIRNGENLTNQDIRFQAGINATKRWRLGNLLFITPGDEESGIAVWDVGDPANPVLRDTLTGSYFQYTTAWQIWRNYIILMIAENINGPTADANFVAIDISNPDDIQAVADYPINTIPGRYMHFQDQYGFSGRSQRGVKVDMEAAIAGVADPVVLEFTPPAGGIFEDFQWIPLGHLLMMSQSQATSSHSYLFSHLDNVLDTTPPTVGYHLPEAGATNQPIRTVVGLVINETLDDTTIDDSTFTVSPVEGPPISGTVISTQYDIINFIPDQPLDEDTTYEVLLVGGGIQDVAGNAIEEYSFLFSTGDSLGGGTLPEITNLTVNPASPVSEGTLVTVQATATDADGDPLEYRWDLGDGSPQTSWGASNVIQHAFTAAGNFTLQVQVRDDDLNSDSLNHNLVVFRPAEGLAPTRSSPIVVDEAARTVWTANPDHGTVSSLDVDTLTGLAEFPACGGPVSLALDSVDQLWVACRESDEIVILDRSNGSVVEIIPLAWGAAPVAAVPSPDHSAVFIVERGTGVLRRFDALTRTETGSRVLGSKPGSLAVRGDGSEILITRFVSDGADGTLWRVPLPSMGPPTSIAISHDDATPDSGTAGRGIPNYLGALAIHPAGDRAWVGGKKDNVYRGQWREGTDLNHETTVRSLISPIDLLNGAEVGAQRTDIDDHAFPSATVASTLGNHLFVAFLTNRRIVALDAFTGIEAAGADTGLGTNGLAFDSISNRLFSSDFLDRQVSVFDATQLTQEHVLTLPQVATVAVTTSEVLDPDVLQGKRVFYDSDDERMTQDGYLSCATCHLDGRQDGRVWDLTQLGEGLRNTTALRGIRGTGHGLIHWSGNFDEVQDFETPIRDHFGGTGFIPDPIYFAGTVAQPLGDPKVGLSSELDALAAYMNSLDTFDRSPYRSPDGALTPAGIRGRIVFQESACIDCHEGEDFSDSDSGLLHDVGTIQPHSGNRLGAPLLGIDTPTLRGIWQSDPYLHDGSAPTLDDLLSAPSGLHSVQKSLALEDYEDLVAYLLQIDGAEPAAPSSALFRDGFEGGTTAAWSGVSP